MTWQVLVRFFTLGWVCFGGPAAHIGYFRYTFVEQLRWLDEREFANLVAVSQFLPGPGSSQLGFAIGHHKAGLSGAIAAFIGFTLPSFLLLYLFAITSSQFLHLDAVQGAIHGLKLLAVVIVADAVMALFTQFCHKLAARLIMLTATVALLLVPGTAAQMLVLALAALAGWRWLSSDKHSPKGHDSSSLSGHGMTGINWWWLLAFALLLTLSLWQLTLASNGLMSIFAQFYQAGSLVFGGGHVVLPLLENSVGRSLSSDTFLSGYALAQAVPGPMFSVASFFGAQMWPQAPLMAALVATVAIFLPGFLLLLALIGAWQALCRKPQVMAAVAGLNAAVVGVLLSTLYDPVFTSAVTDSLDMALVLTGLALLRWFRPSILLLIASFVVTGAALAMI
ncbi:chromate efflux transporter [Shewanella sp. SNU WT4]|uniref:chromate efflux transporter n=1 Tax=Shewanella sp. SNU WT4 TaxID=2590015 RepID=UPI00112D47FE|nr:chromate efflux transporter [Shewanella sp. SNU WT4]QDF68097.1 chromate efflux transporter [Shewanella sp. SNU WT4]